MVWYPRQACGNFLTCLVERQVCLTVDMRLSENLWSLENDHA